MMVNFKGILALLTACLSLCIVLNFLLFHKDRKAISKALYLGAFIFVNQLIEFVTSFWQLNFPLSNFFYITTFNFAVSFSSYYLLQTLQPDSKQNWKSFLFSIMILPVSFVHFKSFAMIDPGLFFTEYRYVASPMANVVIGLLQSFWGLFFLLQLVTVNKELKKVLHYKLLMWGYIVPPVVAIVAILLFSGSLFYFESIFSKLLILNCASLLYFLIKTNK